MKQDEHPKEASEDQEIAIPAWDPEDAERRPVLTASPRADQFARDPQNFFRRRHLP
jgi:hypothetical protein